MFKYTYLCVHPKKKKKKWKHHERSEWNPRASLKTQQQEKRNNKETEKKNCSHTVSDVLQKLIY